MAKQMFFSTIDAAFKQFKLRLVMCLMVWLIAIPVFSQTASTILGIVRDTSGGVVAGANVSILNVETGLSRTVTTTNDGAYRVPALPTGRYTVKIEKAGFKTVTLQELTLTVAEELIANANLEVGASTQEVVVTGETPQVNTSTSSLGGLVDEEKIADLPLNGRNYIDLTLMQSGVAQNRNNGTMGGMSGTVFSSNGAPTISNSFLLDGTSMVNQSGWVGASMGGTTLGVDGIKEYKIITNAFSAEYGMTMGSQMVMVSKGGTNRFHGDVFDYLRNNALDARNFFDYGYQNGGPRLPPFQRNNFGAAFGGPIKKDKTFFFGVYEGVREFLGFTVLDQVPAMACHHLTQQGDGSYRFNTPGDATTCASSGLSTSTVIPSFIYPLLQLFPNPTNNTNNTFTFPTGGRQDVHYGQIRVDQNFSTSDSLFARYTVDRASADAPSATITAFTGLAFPQFRTAASSSDYFITVAENHIVTSTLLNTARVSFARTYFQTATHNDVPLPGVPVFVPGEQLGSLTIGGLSAMGGASVVTSWHLQNIYTLGDDLFYSRGKHALKFGFLGNRYDEGLTAPTSPSGQDTYANIAGFLQGVPSVYNALSVGSDANRDFIFYTLGFYAQDDWRVTSRLTLNLGLRYEFYTTPRELSGKEYAIRNYQRDANYTQGPVMLDKSYPDFSPRLGFAWDVFGKGRTSVRGAFGIYYDIGNWGGAFTQNASGMPPLSAQSRVNNAGANAVVPLPFVFTPQQLGVSASVIGYNNSQPDLFQYNLTVEQQLPKNMALSVGYVGTRGAHLWTEKDGNPTIPTSISSSGLEYFSSAVPTCASVVPSCRINPNWAGLQCDCTTADSWFNSLQVGLTKRASHGLEFQAAYTYSHALNTASGQLKGVDCTGTGMDNGTDPLFPRHDLGPSCFDIRENLRFNLLYHVPNIKTGNAFLSKAVNGWWVGNIVSVQSGYPFSVVSGTLRSQSGLGLQNVTDRINVGNATVAPGAIGPDGNVNLTTKTFIPFDSKTVYTGNPQQWFNPLMFTVQPMVLCPGTVPPAGFTGAVLTCGTPGTASRGLLRGPGLGTWDFSIVKDTALPFLGEQGALQFRAEFFNLLNRANFGMPSGTVFSGTTGTVMYSGGTQVNNTPNVGAYSQAPNTSAGQITNTLTTSRQIQLALKIIF